MTVIWEGERASKESSKMGRPQKQKQKGFPETVERASESVGKTSEPAERALEPAERASKQARMVSEPAEKASEPATCESLKGSH